LIRVVHLIDFNAFSDFIRELLVILKIKVIDYCE
jgi:hypothetical protein